MNPKSFLIPLLCSLWLADLHAQTVAEVRADHGRPRKRAPLLLAEESMAAVPEDVKQRLTAAGKGRPAIPKGKRRYLVHLREDADPAAFAKGKGITCERTFVHAIKMFVACLDDAAVDKLRDADEVLGIEEDRPAAENASQMVPNGLKRMAVQPFPIAMINGLDERIDIDVAVMEGAGVQINHPDLNVYQTASMFGNYVESGHGTAVAGIIGALDNEFGTVGIAPGARIWSINLSGSGTAIYTSDILRGFDYVAEHANEIEVVNCSFGITSWGFQNFRSSYQAAVRACVEKGVVVVCAAMNLGQDIAGPNGVLDDGEITDNILPSAFPESMAVSAVSPFTEQFASYSNFSTTNHGGRFVISPGAAIDVAAPTDIFTTALGSSYSSFGGTSASAPHVAGLVALYIARHGRATDAAGVYRIRQAVVDAAQPQSAWRTDDTLDQDSYPEGLAQVSLVWLADAPKFTRLEKTLGSFDMEFTTLPGYNIVVQKSGTLAPASWENFALVEGNGTPAFVSHPGGLPSQFYRLSIQSSSWPPSDPSLASNLGSTGISAYGTYIDSPRIIGGPLIAEPSNMAVHQSVTSFGGGVKIPYALDLSPTSAFSIEMWVKPARSGLNTAGYSPQFAAARETGGRGWSLNQYPSNSTFNSNGFSFTVLTGGTNYVLPYVEIAVDVNKWYHLIGVVDGANAYLYVDGLLAGSANIPSGQSYLPPLQTGISFGSNNGIRWFEGEFDEAAFYSQALTAAQVLAHYQAGINPTPPIPYPQVILSDNPAGYWRFNEP